MFRVILQQPRSRYRRRSVSQQGSILSKGMFCFFLSAEQVCLRAHSGLAWVGSKTPVGDATNRWMRSRRTKEAVAAIGSNSRSIQNLRPALFYDSNNHQALGIWLRFLSTATDSAPIEQNEANSSGGENNELGPHGHHLKEKNQALRTLSKQELAEIDELTRCWRDAPSLNPILKFPCWRVPKQSNQSLQTILESPLTQSYLATRMDIWEGVRKPRVIQNDQDDDNFKLFLLHPDAPPIEELPDEVQDLLRSHNIECMDANTGDRVYFNQQMRPSDFSVAFILQTLLPPHVHPPPVSFETIGHVAHLNLNALHQPYRYLVGQVLLEVLPRLSTVIQKVGEVTGPYRTYQHEIVAEREQKKTKEESTAVASKKSTVVSFMEWGVGLQFDVQDVYWSSRLSRERQRLVQKEFRSGQWVADAFCGVGALCLQAALHKQCIISANDWNPAAIDALERHVQANKLEDSFRQITCGDAYEFLTSLGLANQHQQPRSLSRGNGSLAPSQTLPEGLPDHVVLNFPLEAASFLGALRWWRPSRSSRKKKLSPQQPKAVVPRVHVYIFAKEPPNDTTLSTSAKNAIMEEMVVDEIASHLLPLLPGQEQISPPTTTPIPAIPGTATIKMTRWDELNQNFGCNVKVHNVRDVAPGKIVYCVSFSATNRLLQYMQGNYNDDPYDDESETS